MRLLCPALFNPPSLSLWDEPCCPLVQLLSPTIDTLPPPLSHSRMFLLYLRFFHR